jgi:hypothetical protein
LADYFAHVCVYTQVIVPLPAFEAGTRRPLVKGQRALERVSVAAQSILDSFARELCHRGCYLTHFIPRPSACSFVTCTSIFTIANSFTEFFWIKLAREVTDDFLPHILNVWFDKFSWIFLLFWDWEYAQNKRLTWPSKWRWAFWQQVCMWWWVCTCRAVRKQQKPG